MSHRTSEPTVHKWWTLAAVCLGTFMLLLDVTIVNVALPDIQTDLGASFSDLQWIVDAYALTLAALLLTTGSLADLYGRKRLYVAGLAVFTLASLGCGLAPTPLTLILARGVQGIGGAAMFSVSLALLASTFHGKERGTAFGIWGAVTGLATAIGPVAGGALTTGLSWRWIFFVNLPVGIIAILATVLRVAESKAPSARRPDWAGFVVFTAAASSLVFALIRSSESSFTAPEVEACFAAAGVLLVLFLLLEDHVEHPMFDLRLFKVPTFVGGSLVAFCLSASLFSMLLYLVLYLQDVLGFSALDTGLRLLVLSGGILLTSTLAGRATSRVPVRYLVGPGLGLVGLGLLLMRNLDATSGWTRLVPGLIVAGIGTGLVNPPLASTAVGVVEPARAGMASGVSSTFRQLGIATGIATLGSVFTTRVAHAVAAGLAGVPGLNGASPTAVQQISTSVSSGQLGPLAARLPVADRAAVGQVARASFVTGLRDILLVAMVVAFVGAVAGLALVRRKDFVASGPAAAAESAEAPAPQSATERPAPEAPVIEPQSPPAAPEQNGFALPLAAEALQAIEPHHLTMTQPDADAQPVAEVEPAPVEAQPVAEVTPADVTEPVAEAPPAVDLQPVAEPAPTTTVAPVATAAPTPGPVIDLDAPAGLVERVQLTGTQALAELRQQVRAQQEVHAGQVRAETEIAVEHLWAQAADRITAHDQLLQSRIEEAQSAHAAAVAALQRLIEVSGVPVQLPAAAPAAMQPQVLTSSVRYDRDI